MKESVKKFKLIIDSFNYAKNYLHVNKCLYCDEKCDHHCNINRAKRYLEIYIEALNETHELNELLGGNENEKI